MSATFRPHRLCTKLSLPLLWFVRSPQSNTPAVAAEPIVGTASVIDCDTIEIHGTRIRLHGIYSPESRQECTRPDGTNWRCGQQAALTLSDRIGRSTFRCEVYGRERYGRAIAICFKVTENLNRRMVASGWAVADRKYALDYVVDEEKGPSGQGRTMGGYLRHGMGLAGAAATPVKA